MRVEPSVKWAFIVACVALLAGAISFQVVASAVKAWLVKAPAPLRESLGTIPMTLGRWKSMTADEQLSDEMIESLGTKQYLTRTYAIDGEPSKGMLQLHLAYYTGLIDRVPHVPERCFVAGGLVQRAPAEVRMLPIDRRGWRDDAGPVNVATGRRYTLATIVDPITGKENEVRLPIGEAEITVGDYQDPIQPELHLLGGYLFVANGRMTARAGDIRQLSYLPTERFAYFCKVQFTGGYRGSEPDFDTYTANVADLLSALLPHLMQRLPDWPAYEGKSQPAASSS